MMRTIIMSVLALGLMACSGDDAVDCGDCERPADHARLIPASEASATAEPSSDTIPARFHGLWDVMDNMGSCEEWSDMRLEIEPARVIFYEAPSEVITVSEQGNAVVLDIAGEAEGESFTSTIGLRLNDAGQLIVVDPENPQQDALFARGRCP